MRLKLVKNFTLALVVFLLYGSMLSCSRTWHQLMPVRISTFLSVTPEGNLTVFERIQIPATHRDLDFTLSRTEGIVKPKSLNLQQVFQNEAALTPDSLQEDINKQGFTLSWPIPSSTRSKVFELHYTISSHILNHFDTAQLYFPCLQLSDKTHLKEWDVQVNLPYVDDKDLLAWIRGRSSNKLEIMVEDDLFLTAKAQEKKLDHYVQVLFPTSAIPLNSNKSLEFSLSRIIESEQSIDLLIADYKNNAESIWIWSLIIMLLTFVYVFSQWCKNIRCFKHDPVKTYTDRPPDLYHPAELGIVHRYGKLDVRDLVATLFHLAEKGYFGIQEYVLFIKNQRSKTHMLDYRFFLKNNSWDNLMTYEQIIMHSLFKEFSEDGHLITLYEIQKIFTRNPKKYHRFWKSWVTTLQKRNIILKLFDHKVLDRQKALKVLGSLFLSFGFFFFFFIMLFLPDYYYLIPLSLSLFISGIFTFLLSLFFKKRSNAAEKQYRIYLSYRRYLNDLKTYYFNKKPPSVRHFEAGLPYAIIWEIEENLLESLSYLYSSSVSNSEIFANTFYSSSLSGENPSRIYQNINSMIHTMLSAFSKGSKLK